MPLHAAGDLLVGEAVVDVAGHAPVQLLESVLVRTTNCFKRRGWYRLACAVPAHRKSHYHNSALRLNKNFLWKFTSVFANNDWAPFHKIAIFWGSTGDLGIPFQG